MATVPGEVVGAAERPRESRASIFTAVLLLTFIVFNLMQDCRAKAHPQPVPSPSATPR